MAGGLQEQLSKSRALERALEAKAKKAAAAGGGGGGGGGVKLGVAFLLALAAFVGGLSIGQFVASSKALRAPAATAKPPPRRGGLPDDREL